MKNNLLGYEVQFSSRAEKQLSLLCKKDRNKIFDKLNDINDKISDIYFDLYIFYQKLQNKTKIFI
jgi:mRNA-degrading endonuclease RelE of RelBE toxin-antitoxin system